VKAARLVVAEAARSDLADIRAWLSENASPRIAAQVLTAVRKRLLGIKAAPFAGVAELGAKTRFAPCGSYVIYYDADPKLVTVLRVLHAARDRDSILGRDG
jgi:plasmid stabilization system protein ParE